MKKVYIITGSSSGFGRALAEAVLDRGDHVVLTARKPDNIADLAEKYPARSLTVRLDVTNPSDRDVVLSKTMQRFGQVDVLVNNAGQGSLGAFEEFSSDQIRRHFEVNSFGVFEMSRMVLPIMRQQRSGHILNITSVGGVASMGGFSLYCATKFAVEGFSEGLRDEVKPLGIRVTIVEPGAFRTNFAGEANMRPVNIIDDYQPLIEPIRQYLDGSSGQQPGDPHKAALAMIDVVESEDPPLRLMLGVDAYSFWEQKNAALREDLAKWRSVGENTAFEDAKVRPIGG
jgi:short-subunit dehydrogenase